jgi:asparagine synthase (glutamine-hydrolysing)
VLEESIRLRMVAERPLGAFLSGGVDSSVVVATMAGLATGPVKTFSVGFDDPRFDERPYARMVAERYGTEHHEVVLKPTPEVVFERPAVAYDEPFGDSSAVPSLELARFTRQHVTVALNGDGGDESFAGYGRYGVAQLAASLPVPRALAAAGLRAGGSALAAAPPGSRRSRLRTGLRFLAMKGGHGYPAMTRGFTADQRAALYGGELRQATAGGNPIDAIERHLRSSPAADDVDRLLLADIESYLVDDLLVKMDIATMAHSVEARSPFLACACASTC